MWLIVLIFLSFSEVNCDVFEFFAEFFWIGDSSSINEDGLSHVLYEVFWFEFFEFVPFCYEDAAVSIFRHSMGDEAYLILFLKRCLAFGMAAGS